MAKNVSKEIKMFYELFNGMGLSGSLITDVVIIIEGLVIAFFMVAIMQIKGLFMPLVRSRLKKENIAIIDLGGIETPIINYPRGAGEVVYEHKGDRLSWTIPDGIEREFTNNSRYILLSKKLGVGYYANLKEELELANYLSASQEASSIDKVADLLNHVRKVLSPKVQANIIDDRAKQLSEMDLANVNKPMIYGVMLGIIGIVMIGGYLIITKASEYSLCSQALINTANAVTTTTLPQLPPL